MSRRLKINKIEAARGQLYTATKLFFEDGDPVSIHTLTCAAYQILIDVGKKKGFLAIVKNEAYIRPEKEKWFKQQVNKAENFFKHAEKDTNALLVFYPASTQFILWDACRMLNAISEKNNPFTQIFFMWFYRQNLAILKDGVLKETIKDWIIQGLLADKWAYWQAMMKENKQNQMSNVANYFK